MSEKTEEPTDKKLDDARKKGQVAHAKDFTKALIFLVFMLYFALASGYLIEQAIELIIWSGEHSSGHFQDIFPALLQLSWERMFSATLPLLFIPLLIGGLSEFLYSGPVFSMESISPKLEKINPLPKIKQWFSMRNLIELVKSSIKIALLCTIAWKIIVGNLGVLMLAPGGGIDYIGAVAGKMLGALALGSLAIFIIFGGADAFLQRFLFRREQRMSKDDIKREYKDSEGDPHVKQHRKQLHREMGEDSPKKAVQRSTAVVVNPTHFAVALRYVAGETPLPIVMAKGADSYAREIINEALAINIPVIRNVMLARALIAEAEIDDYIPRHLIEQVAEVLRIIEAHKSGSDQETP